MDNIKISFNEIIRKVINDFDISREELSNVLGCDVSTVSNYMNYKTAVSIDKAVALKAYLEKYFDVDIYDRYIYFVDNGFYFHGSRQGIKGKISPNYVLSRKTTDFGRGFYLGETFKQSSTFVSDEKSGDDLIYKFKLDLDNLKVRVLNDVEWVLFVGFNRGKIERNSKNRKIILMMESILSKGYDVIMGKIADDKMSINMEEFFSNRLTYGQILKCITQLKIGDQYCLKTQKACDSLELVNTYTLDDATRYLINNYAVKQRNDAVDAANIIVSKSPDDNLYFDDLIKKYGK